MTTQSTFIQRHLKWTSELVEVTLFLTTASNHRRSTFIDVIHHHINDIMLYELTLYISPIENTDVRINNAMNIVIINNPLPRLLPHRI